MNIERHDVLPRRRVKAPGEAVVRMRVGRQVSVDAPEPLAGGIRVDLGQKAFVVPGPNFPARIVETGL